MHRTGGGIVLAVALAVGACGSSAASTVPGDAAPPAAPTGLPEGNASQLLGPWSPTPFGVPLALLARIDDACRASMQPFPAGVSIAVADARGQSVVQIYYSGPNGNNASCNGVEIDAKGEVQPVGGGSTGGRPAFEGLGAFDLVITDLSGSGSVRHPPVLATYVAGRLGAGIASVVLVSPAGVMARATVANGWFAVWFPGALPDKWFLRGLDGSGAEVASLPGR